MSESHVSYDEVKTQLTESVTPKSPLLLVGTRAPSFNAKAIEGGKVVDVDLSALKGKWVVLFSFPHDIRRMSHQKRNSVLEYVNMREQFQSVNCEVLGITDERISYCTEVAKSPNEDGGWIGCVPFPIICDRGGEVSREYGFYDEISGNNSGMVIIDGEGLVWSHAIMSNFSFRVEDVFSMVKECGKQYEKIKGTKEAIDESPH
jgi:alkyl hydroperoxide reductase subunit AhpC